MSQTAENTSTKKTPWHLNIQTVFFSNSKTAGSYDLGSLLHKFLQGKALVPWIKIQNKSLSGALHLKLQHDLQKKATKSPRITRLIFYKPQKFMIQQESPFFICFRYHQSTFSTKHPPLRATCRSFHTFVEHSVDGWNVLHDWRSHRNSLQRSKLPANHLQHTKRCFFKMWDIPCSSSV